MKATRAELLLFVAAITLGVAFMVVLGGPALFTRPFWLDEMCCTMYAVREASSLPELFRYATAYDIGPPLLHLIVWTITGVVGSSSPLVVRCIMLLSIAIALVLLYAGLRRRFAVAPSVAGVLAVASHSLVVHHAFDARFYGPWVLFAVAYALSLTLDPGQPSRRRDILQGALAVCISSIHWFGITSLVVMAVAAAATRLEGGRWREALRFVAPSAAGPIAWLALSPVMLAQLGHGGEGILWVPSLSGLQIMQMTQLFLLRLPIALSLILLVGDQLVRSRRRAPIGATLRDPFMAALLSLILMPVVLAIITLVLEPVMVSRYAILAALAAAPVAAMAVSTLGRAGRALVLTLFSLFMIGFADREVQFSENYARVIGAYKAQFERLKAANPHLLVVFQSQFILYGVDGERRQQSVARILEMSEATIESLYPDPSMEESRRIYRVANAASRLHQETFGFPVIVTQAQLDSLPGFLFFATDDALPLGHQEVIAFGKRVFPLHQGRRLSDIVTVFERLPSPRPPTGR